MGDRFNIKKAFRDKAARKWESLYWAIDLHDTVITGTYNKHNEGSTIFPNADKVLRYLTERADMKLILWSSSYKSAATEQSNILNNKYGIVFDHFNFNPDVRSTNLADFSSKFYFNILLDDKAGFRGRTDWYKVEKHLRKIGEWK